MWSVYMIREIIFCGIFILFCATLLCDILCIIYGYLNGFSFAAWYDLNYICVALRSNIPAYLLKILYTLHILNFQT